MNKTLKEVFDTEYRPTFEADFQTVRTLEQQVESLKSAPGKLEAELSRLVVELAGLKAQDIQTLEAGGFSAEVFEAVEINTRRQELLTKQIGRVRSLAVAKEIELSAFASRLSARIVQALTPERERIQVELVEILDSFLAVHETYDLFCRVVDKELLFTTISSIPLRLPLNEQCQRTRRICGG